MNDPNTQKQITQALRKSNSQVMGNNYGMIIDYHRVHNTATVVMSKPHSNHPAETYTNVPCPYIPGMQYAAPEMGRMCWVEFKSSDRTNPVITHFFSPGYEQTDHQIHSQSKTSIPKFMVDM